MGSTLHEKARNKRRRLHELVPKTQKAQEMASSTLGLTNMKGSSSAFASYVKVPWDEILPEVDLINYGLPLCGGINNPPLPSAAMSPPMCFMEEMSTPYCPLNGLPLPVLKIPAPPLLDNIAQNTPSHTSQPLVNGIPSSFMRNTLAKIPSHTSQPLVNEFSYTQPKSTHNPSPDSTNIPPQPGMPQTSSEEAAAVSAPSNVGTNDLSGIRAQILGKPKPLPSSSSKTIH